jgi:hypothetical protein
MLIRYTKNNIHALGSHDGKEIKWLTPGWNEFPSHIWKQYENDAEIKKMIADGAIELLADKVTVKEGRKTVTKVLGAGDEELRIKDLPEPRAIELVKQTLNRGMLQRWDDEETRHKVKRALAAQIKPLLPESQTSTAE